MRLFGFQMKQVQGCRALLRSLAILFAAIATCASAGATKPASPQLKREFVQAGLQIPKALRELGYTRFGDLDLTEFMAKIPRVQVFEDDGHGVGDRNDDGRVSARWEIHADRLTVTINPAMWARRMRQRPSLALHEYLCVLGFNDRNYWLSTELWFLSLKETHEKLTARERSAVEKRVADLTRIKIAGGGSVGVGGGGESTTLLVRMDRIERKLAELGAGSFGKEREDAVGSIFDQLESNVTVSYTTPKRQKRLEEQAKKKVPTACLTSRGTCALPPRPMATGSNTCSCPGAPDGLVIYPH